MSNISIHEGQEIQKSTTTQMMVSRQAQEVQAAIVIAKRFQRDEVDAYNKILRACERQRLAEQAEYEFPRGGKMVKGPSIRLAEAIAQNWGNIDYGVVELEQSEGSSEMMAYAWDLETNTRATRIFKVAHKRDTKKGSYMLKDSRDIYETTANFGARRMRACILQVIPGDVVEAAVNQCRKTIKGDSKVPLVDRVRKMVKAFNDEFSVTKEMIEQFLGCNSDSISENGFIKLRNVYSSLKDGMAKREDYFKISLKIEDPFKEEDLKDNKEKIDLTGTPYEEGK